MGSCGWSLNLCLSNLLQGKFTFMSLRNVFHLTNTNIAWLRAGYRSKRLANIHSFHPHNDLVTLVLLLSCLKDEATGVGHSNWEHRWQNQSLPQFLWGTESCSGSDSGSQTGLDRGSVSCQGVHSTSLSKVAGRDGALSLGHGSNPGISPHHPRNPFSFSTVGSPASRIPHLPLS